MITASHNPKHDNGLKIIERDGSVLNLDWESIAEEIVNAPCIKEKLLELDSPDRRAELGLKQSIFAPSDDALVCMGIDTRESGPRLQEAAMKGFYIMGV